MHEIDLAIAVELTENRLADEPILVRLQVGLDRQTAFGCRVDHADFPNTDEAHVQCARNGRGSEREYVDGLAQLLELLLMPNAEALLLVDDEQAEALEVDVLLQ